MKRRPTSITVISWILIVLGGVSLISSLAMINNPKVVEVMGQSPIPIPIQHAMSFLGITVMITSGIFMLKGCNWARFLYVILTGINFLIGIISSPMKEAMIPGLAVFLLIAIFLFLPKANAYFSRGYEPGDE